MTVQELIDELKKLDGNLPVVIVPGDCEGILEWARPPKLREWDQNPADKEYPEGCIEIVGGDVLCPI